FRFDSNSDQSGGFLDYLHMNVFRRKPAYRGTTPLMAAIEGRHVKTALFLIRRGSTGVNASNPGRSFRAEFLLHSAVNMHNQELVNALLDKGADIEVKDYIECTPLAYAIIQQDPGM